MGCVLRACAPCLCWVDQDVPTNGIDAINCYLSLLTDACKIQREQQHAFTKKGSTTDNNDQSNGVVLMKEEGEEEEEEEEKEDENSLQFLLDELFEWHLPNVSNDQTRLHLIRVLASSW